MVSDALRELIQKAVEAGATHVHLEPARARIRVDGLLRSIDSVPLFHEAFELQGDGFRAHGAVRENLAVVRIVREPTRPAFDPDGGPVRGVLARVLPRLEKAFTHRQGLIFLTGPARSGLSTTLRAWVDQLDPEQYHLLCWSEDPVTLPGVTPMSGEPSVRELVELDPDVVLVDRPGALHPETLVDLTRLAQRYLVVAIWPGWSDVCDFLLRMRDAGVISSLVRTVVNQRLVRRVCLECRESYLIEHPFFKEGTRAYRARGCAACSGTGYRGQMALFEIVEVTGEMKELLLRQPTLARLRQTTFTEALFRDGCDQVRAGDTTLEEAERVLGPAPPELE